MGEWRRWLDGRAIWAGAGLLTALHVLSYLSMVALPGRSSRVPEGWWGWFDQGKTLLAARAFAGGDLTAVNHWYPPGYALLGAVFVRLGFGLHPFVLVDLACLLLTLWAFIVFAAACGVSRGVAAALFVGGVGWNAASFGEWSIPWNSTPTACLVWAVLAVCARWLAGVRRPVLLGVLVAAIPVFRPTELPAMLACVAWVMAADWRVAGTAGRVVRLAAGAACVLVPYAGLHLAIYGPEPSEYMVHSRELGFTLHDFGWKAYVVLVDPYAWFTDGPGLLRHLPWMMVGVAGAVPALVRGRAPGVLAAALVVHMVVYVSYVDMLPLGLWRYGNVHYWKWAIPGFALLGWLLVVRLAHWLAYRRARPDYAAAAGVLVAAVLSVVRVAPVVVPGLGTAKMIELHGDAPGFDQSYHGHLVLHDARGELSGEGQVRAFPVPGGMRVITLSREIEGAVTIDPAPGLSPGLLASEPVRYGERLVLGRPCWMPASRCGAREVNGLLPEYVVEW